jgi:hypothetical protein
MLVAKRVWPGCRFWLSQGAERLVFECCEVVSLKRKGLMGSMLAFRLSK